ncbi:MAG: hypothetical protein AB7E81_17625 [Hyphomicrobiaceae bacterium]
MAEPKKDDKDQRHLTANSVSGASLDGQTLLPMLIAGLILIVVGMLVVVLVV